MKEGSSSPKPTRRQMLSGFTLALGGMASGSLAPGQTKAPPPMQEPPSTPTNQGRTFLHQEVAFKVSPQRLYDLLLDSKSFAAFTGMPAEIDRKPGGAFTTFGGLIAGRNVEFIAGQRIV